MLERTLHCIKMLKQSLNLQGDVAECGVAFGQTCFFLDRFIIPTGKTLFAFDTFEGLPYDDSITSEDMCLEGEMDYGEVFFGVFDELERTSIQPVKGLVEETLKQVEDKKFCFVWLDMDLYQSTLYAYKFFEDRMVEGGIIGFHDYDYNRCPGIKKVVDKEVDFDKYETVLNEDTCYFIRKKHA